METVVLEHYFRQTYASDKAGAEKVAKEIEAAVR
jgi:hypothetical protein